MSRWQKLAMVLLLAALVVAPFGLVRFAVTNDRPSVAAQPMLPSGARWTATAPGRIEPQGGEYRLIAPAPGRIVDVTAAAGDKVMRGDLLVRLDDAEIAARIAGVAADLALKKYMRDGEEANDRAKRRYAADDAQFVAEQGQVDARLNLDRLVSERRQGNSKADDIASARARLQTADTDLTRARDAAANIRTRQGTPDPNAAEVAVIAARSQWSALQALLDQMRVRAPVDGTVMASSAKVGEIAGPGAPEPLMTVGDLTRLRVRAEIDGRDFQKVQNGQRAVVRIEANDNAEFSGRVTSIAPGLLPGKLSPRGPRRSGDFDVLEVTITFDSEPPLVPGMRADVFFVADQNTPAGEKP
jgi:HlyD family secretion protein